MKRAIKSVRGQSTLEYILVIAAVLIALVAVTSGAIGPAVKKMSNESGSTINGASGEIMGSLGLDQGQAPAP